MVPSGHEANLLVWYGQVTTGRSLRARGLALLAGALAWLAVFLVLPLMAMVAVAFIRRGVYGQLEWELTFDNFRRLLGFGVLGWSADYLRILGRTVWMATVTTAVSLLLAYPLCFFIAAQRPRLRYALLALVVIPSCTNLVIRTYAWQLILSERMPTTWLAQALGFIDAGQSLYPGAFAVYVGMVNSSLPFAVLPLYTNVERLDWSLVEAARDLYASRRRTFAHAILPQTLPGLAVAAILTMIPAMGAFVVPDLLGGGKTILVGNLIKLQFADNRDWPFGAALSFALMVLMLAGLLVLRRRGAEAQRP